MGVSSLEVTDTLAYFQCLGRLVDQRWSARGRKPDSLPEIAEEALGALAVPEGLSPASILGALAVGTGLPGQRKSSDPFGQPPATMYRAEDLEVQAITWMEGTTSIHQHGFDGAFRMTCGSSLHVRYDFFEEDRLADAHLLVGRLHMGALEILQSGDVRPIVAGPDFIHALFHLERPSMTIVVRNNSSNLPIPQYDYRIPGLAVDGLFSDDRLRMRLRGLHSLHEIDRDAALQVALEIAGSQDLWTAFRVLDDWARSYGSGHGLDALVEEVGHRHPALSALLDSVYVEEVRRARLLARRGMLSESHHRLFLAFIVNLSDRTSIRSAIQQAFPGQEPDTLILRWVQELASPAYRGISGLTIGPDDLALLEAQLADGRSGEAFEALAARWRPSPLLEKLFI